MQEITVITTCDMCGKATDNNPTTLAGNRIIDLCAAHRADYTTQIEPFHGKSRPAPTPTRTHTRKTPTRSNNHDPRAVRAWANSNGVIVPARGRLPQNVIDAYQAAG